MVKNYLLSSISGLKISNDFNFGTITFLPLELVDEGRRLTKGKFVDFLLNFGISAKFLTVDSFNGLSSFVEKMHFPVVFPK